MPIHIGVRPVAVGLASALSVGLVAASVQAAPYPQPGFQGNGPGNVERLVLTSDGRLMVSGTFPDFDGVSWPGPVLRLTADGAWDRTFNLADDFADDSPSRAVMAAMRDGSVILGDNVRLRSDGSVHSTLATGLDDIHAAAMQPDGKIVLAGRSAVLNVEGGKTVVRLNADGTPDTSFTAPSPMSFDVPTPGGTEVRTINPVPSNQAGAIALQSDGKILVAGDTLNDRWEVIRLNPDGSRDPTFAAGPTSVTYIRALAVLDDGRILVGGEAAGWGAQYLVCLKPDGTPDPGFSAGTGIDGEVTALTRAADGKVLVGGSFSNHNGVNGPALFRLNADASLDRSFTVAPVFDRALVSGIVIQPNGKIVVGGSLVRLGKYFVSGLVRLGPNGTLDKTFAPTPRPVAPTRLRVIVKRRSVRVHWQGSTYAWQHTVKLRGRNPAGSVLRRTRNERILGDGTDQESRITVRLKKKSRAKVCVFARNGVGNSPAVCKRLKVRWRSRPAGR